MRFDDKELTLLAQRPGQLEGRLQYRAPPGTFRDSGFRERFFRLVNNLLFYFRLSEVGQIDFKEPVGVLVLENYSVRVETDSELSFAFGLLFLDEPDRQHLFTARSDVDVNKWVHSLRQASYQHWKLKLDSMQCNITALKEARDSNMVITSSPNTKQRSISDNDLSLLDLGERQGASPQRQRRNPFLVPPTLPPKLPPRNQSPTNQNNNSSSGSDLIQW